MNISPALTFSREPRQRILVIEDDETFRSLLVQVLRFAGYEVAAAGDGAEGVLLARRERFDLVITDMIMPGKEGIETILEIRQALPNLRIIAMSGGGRNAAGNFLPLALKLGASVALEKPFGRVELLAAVEEVLVPECQLLVS